jgi:ParB family chromosome partitioning protein
VGHAKVLLGVKNPEEQRLLAEKLIRSNASVRDAEQLVAAHLAGATSEKKRRGGRKRGEQDKPAHIRNIENRLRQRFNTGISVHESGKKGHISIDYYGPDDLNRLLGELGISAD